MTDETTAIMQTMAKTLDSFLNGKVEPKRVGFVLLVFPFDGPEGARTNYVSNGERESTLIALREIVARMSGQHQEGGRA
jgi:hypothetical protein